MKDLNIPSRRSHTDQYEKAKKIPLELDRGATVHMQKDIPVMKSKLYRVASKKQIRTERYCGIADPMHLSLSQMSAKYLAQTRAFR